MRNDLFADAPPVRGTEELDAGAWVLRGYALDVERELLAAVDAVAGQAPFRRMVTPGGLPMSVEMTNCGDLGWVSDRRGYRYTAIDPATGRRWPPLPEVFAGLAATAAERVGYARFRPDACLVNRYAPGTRLSLHQDRNERDFDAPIVSVSLGVPALFLWGGSRRADPVRRIPLEHGDVVVWGGPARLRYHGVAPLRAREHRCLGPVRVNLTLRRAG